LVPDAMRVMTRAAFQRFFSGVLGGLPGKDTN
jgi:hypothetical protein